VVQFSDIHTLEHRPSYNQSLRPVLNNISYLNPNHIFTSLEIISIISLSSVQPLVLYQYPKFVMITHSIFEGATHSRPSPKFFYSVCNRPPIQQFWNNKHSFQNTVILAKVLTLSSETLATTKTRAHHWNVCKPAMRLTKSHTKDPQGGEKILVTLLGGGVKETR
jgi:hypothetical protein